MIAIVRRALDELELTEKDEVRADLLELQLDIFLPCSRIVRT